MYLPIDCQVAASCIDPKFAPIASILHEVQMRGREAFYDNKIETAFDLKVMCNVECWSACPMSRCCLSTPQLEVRDWPVT